MSADFLDDNERVSDAAREGYSKSNQGDDKGYLHVGIFRLTKLEVKTF